MIVSRNSPCTGRRVPIVCPQKSVPSHVQSGAASETGSVTRSTSKSGCALDHRSHVHGDNRAVLHDDSPIDHRVAGLLGAQNRVAATGSFKAPA